VSKFALLIGVSQYSSDLKALPAAERDIEALKQVLQQPDVGGFTEVKAIANPDLITMQLEIQRLFSRDRRRDDLLLLFFSGHGITDEQGWLYFATPHTSKEEVQATTVSAHFVQGVMNNCRAKRQILILDCCFSGAFAKGLQSKAVSDVDISAKLGGEGRAVLTSSTSTQYSFEQDGSDLSIYTHYIVEGLESGSADLDHDGRVSVDELHKYASEKVREMTPSMTPKIFLVEQGYDIFLAQAPTTDPKLVYRREVERLVSQGDISSVGRSLLEALRQQLKLTVSEAAVIEAEVLGPRQEYNENLQRYKQTFADVIARARLQTSDRTELARIQHVLHLQKEDTQRVEAEETHKRAVSLYEIARRHYREQHWQQTLDIAREIQALNTVYDPDSLFQKAQNRLNEAHQERRLADLYHRGHRYIDAQEWQKALELLEELSKVHPNYRDIAALKVRVQQQLNRTNHSLFPAVLFIVLGWIFAALIGSVPDVGIIAGLVGGCINGIAILLASQSKESTPHHQLLQIIVFGAIGAIVGVLIWQIDSPSIGIERSAMMMIRVLVGSVLGVGALVVLQQLPRS
jgi:tetratricopeptide (TPR) repeat protein